MVYNACKSPPQSLAQRPAIFCLCALLAFFAACKRGPSENRPSENGPSETAAPKAQAGARRYSLKGMVVSIDQRAGKATINNEPISGFMDQMVMAYTIRPSAALDRLQPGDSITADVVVDPDKYWLENVKVVAHSPTPAKPPAK